MVIRLLRSAVCGVLVACSGSISPDGQDAPATPQHDDEAEAAAAQCESSPIPVELIPQPEMLFLLGQFDSGCGFPDPESRVLLINASSEPVQIDSLRVSAKFSADVEGLPLELGPGQRLPVTLKYKSSSKKQALCTLVVSGPQGCAAFQAYAESVDPNADGFAMYSPDAIDFGHVPAGTASELQTVTIRGKSPSVPSMMRNFSVDPAFELVDAPETIEFDGCGETELMVRFLAPEEPGFVSGYLSWETSSTYKGQELTSSVTYNLIGDSD